MEEIQHPIFKAIVQVFNQEDCNRALNICTDHHLPMWKNVELAFDYINSDHSFTYFRYNSKLSAALPENVGFFVDSLDSYEIDIDEFNMMSIEEFEVLAEDYYPIYESVDDILSKLKEINNLINTK
jgi:hypothetical protein